MNNFGYALFMSFFTKLDLYVSSIFTALMTAFGNFGRAFVVLYIVCMAIFLMYGNGGEKTKSLGVSIILLALLWAMIMETNLYFNWFIDPIVGITLDLSSFFIGAVGSDNFPVGSGLSTLFKNLDAISFKVFDLAFKVKPSGNFALNAWSYLQTGLLAVILLGCFTAAYVAFLVQIILGFFSMYVMFVVGGICIFFAAFRQTRFIFWAWLKAVINYSLLVVFSSIVMSICFFGLSDAIDKLIVYKGAAALATPAYWMTICWAILTFAMLRKAADYASSLSGGQAGSTSNIVGSIGAAAGIGAGMIGLKSTMTPGGVAGGIAGGAKKGAAAVQVMGGGMARGYSAMKGMLPGTK
jgi:type IV secretory pathway VirB6-like protein